MAAMESAGAVRSLFGRTGDWWRKRREHAATLAGLRECGGDEFSRLAHDIGVGPSELQVLAGKWPDAADLVARRAAALGLEIAEIERAEPQVMHDLERVCSLCGNKRACEHDLGRNPEKSDWKDYCPNAETLSALRDTQASKVN